MRDARLDAQAIRVILRAGNKHPPEAAEDRQDEDRKTDRAMDLIGKDLVSSGHRNVAPESPGELEQDESCHDPVEGNSDG